MTARQRFHLVGIGGIGMSALAHLLIESGCDVSGTDARPGPAADALRKAGADVRIGHASPLIDGADRVVFSPAIPRSNPELRAARRRRLGLQTRAEALAELVSQRSQICVAGSHGKTTTTAMLAFVLMRAKLDPGFMVGGSASSLERTSARLGTGPFVLEACEAFGALDTWQPAHCIVTNVDDEHADHYGGFEHLQSAFARMLARVPPGGRIVVCGDDPALRAIADRSGRDVITYGFGSSNAVRAELTSLDANGSCFTAWLDRHPAASISLGVPGQHNVCNALGVITLVTALGIPVQNVAGWIGEFDGVDRRWQFVGEAGGVRAFDDYAHHPTEIEAVVAVARRAGQTGRLVLAFEPQLHSRVRHLASRFAEALAGADLVLLAPVDGAGETPAAQTDRALAHALAMQGVRFIPVPNVQLIAEAALEALQPGDLFVTVGPGAIAAAGGLVVEGLRAGASRASILPSISSGAENASPPPTVLARFLHHAAHQPDSPAASCGTASLTYRELAARAEALANQLAAAGVRAGHVVAVELKPSVDRAAAFLAIAMAGGVYLPIDRAAPEERRVFMLDDARVRATISHGDRGENVLRLRPDRLEQQHQSAIKSTAYIIYTSGTTGTPKAVAVDHGALANLARAASTAFEIAPSSRVSQVSAFGFDVAIGDMAAALYAGACLVFPTEDRARLGTALGRFVIESAVTHLSLTPTALSTMPSNEYRSLTHVIVAGEPCPQEIADRFSASCRFFNAYGPTEAAIFSTIEECRTGQPVTIGRPIENVVACVLDAHHQPVGRGYVGELWLGGAGLAHGYLHSPELTAERFRFVELNAGPVRLYDTGDLARMLPDGRLDCLGRADRQVKLRGFRIELGEVEAALQRHQNVGQAVVDVRKDLSGRDQIVAYVVSSDGTPPSRDELRTLAARWLPRYMLPAAVVGIPRIPISANGKCDRASLPEPLWSRAHRPARRPGSAVEARLIQFLCRELGCAEHEIGVRDAFGEIGADSLAMARLFHEIELQFGVELPVEAMSDADTVELLALRIEHARNDWREPQIDRSLAESIRRRQLGYLSAWAGTRLRPESLIVAPLGAAGPPDLFWCCQGTHEHQALAALMERDRRVYGMRSGHQVFSYSNENVQALASLYADEVTALQADGRIRLGGNCQGGTIAREVALQLRARGRDIALLCLMEPSRFFPYDGSVALIFGEASHLNPFQSIEDPDRIFSAAYGSRYSVDIIPGSHGEYFKSPSVEVLAEILKERLDRADKEAP